MDPITSAITASIASATTGTPGAPGDTSTTLPDTGTTASPGSTGTEGGDEGTEGVAAATAGATDTTDSTSTATDSGALDANGQPIAQKPPKRKYIPYENHEKTLAKTRREYDEKIAALTEEIKGVAWAKDPEAQARVRAMDLAESDPDRFATLIVQDGKLATSLRKALGITKAEATAAVAGTTTADPNASRPKPNKRMKGEDGNEVEYYDHDGLMSLLDWQASRVKADAMTEMQKHYEERFGPIEGAFKATAVWNDALARNKQRLDHARTNWDGFKEHEATIRTMYLADAPEKGGTGKLSLEDCYRTVVITAIKAKADAAEKASVADRNKIRQELIAEANAKAAAVGERGEAAPVGDASHGPVDLDQVIKREVARAGRR